MFRSGTWFRRLFSWFACDAEGGMTYSLENSRNPFIFKGHVPAIFMVRL
jgi:hypothetical protein